MLQPVPAQETNSSIFWKQITICVCTRGHKNHGTLQLNRVILFSFSCIPYDLKSRKWICKLEHFRFFSIKICIRSYRFWNLSLCSMSTNVTKGHLWFRKYKIRNWEFLALHKCWNCSRRMVALLLSIWNTWLYTPYQEITVIIWGKILNYGMCQNCD